MCPDCTLKTGKMHRIVVFFFLCHQDNSWCDLHRVNNFLRGSVNWSQKCSFSLSLFYYFAWHLHGIWCMFSHLSLQTSACSCQRVDGQNPSETLAKTWASAIKISGNSSDCSYEVPSQLDGNSWHLPPHQGRKTLLQNDVLICKKRKKKSRGRFGFCKVPAVLNEQKGEFSAYQQHLGNGNATSSSTFWVV